MSHLSLAQRVLSTRPTWSCHFFLRQFCAFGNLLALRIDFVDGQALHGTETSVNKFG